MNLEEIMLIGISHTEDKYCVRSQLSKVRDQKKSNSQSQSGVVVAMVTKKPKRAAAQYAYSCSHALWKNF